MTLSQNISLEVINKLNRIFLENNWNISNEDDIKVYNEFCKLLNKLDEKQQELLFELTKSYLRIRWPEIPKYFRIALGKIPKQPDIIKRFFIIPLLTNEDRDKHKSSIFIWYALRDIGLNVKSHLTVEEVIFARKNWLSSILEKNDWKVLLVDDFIGTGETAEKAINDLIHDTGIEKSRIIIVVLVAQEPGIRKLESQGISVVCSVSRDRGISDVYSGKIRQEYIRLMESIEGNIKIRDGFHFGYKRSEALVTLIRTPNNTFPVFWEKETINDGSWPAPFARE